MDGVYLGQSSYLIIPIVVQNGGVNGYSLRVIRGCILHDDANI